MRRNGFSIETRIRSHTIQWKFGTSILVRGLVSQQLASTLIPLVGHISSFWYDLTPFVCSLNPVLDAEIATPCGHSFCGFCVEQFKANGKTNCQKCKQPVTTYIKNLFANDMMATVDGECSWCKEKLKLDTAKQHVRQCNLLQKPCDLCHQTFKRADLQQHLQECIFRDVICSCGTRIKKKDEENHIATTCAFKEEPCPLNCGDTVKRSVKFFNY